MPPKRTTPPKIKAPTMKTIKTCLSKDAQLDALRSGFKRIPDRRRNGGKIALADVLMSGYAVFDLKDPSLLAFDNRRLDDADNLQRIYGIGQVACDTQLRTVLDPVDPELLRPNFRSVIAQLQRGNALQRLAYYQGHYLLSLDGTGSYGSRNLSSASCLVKKNRDGSELYYQQVLGAAVVHPGHRTVIPLAPEMIIPQDGATKNDCERNAAKRFLPKFRSDFPRLPVIVIEDGLSSNGPHIRDLQQHNMRFILGAKPGDHPLLFENLDKAMKNGASTTFAEPDASNPEIMHSYCFLNDTPLNQANPDLSVNLLVYEEHNTKTGKTQRFSWVTDFPITEENAHILMRGGRSRWKIENETFNTLKNQGYNLEHNYGLGKEHLSENFVTLMMLAFLVDQAQQLCSPLFQAALEKKGSKRALWEEQRNLFRSYELNSMSEIYTMIVNGFIKPRPNIIYDE
jgi:hypothetical protein